MNHPYSGSASYIYANEYRSPTELVHPINRRNKLPSATSNHCAPQQRLEIDVRLNSPPDATHLEERRRAKPSRHTRQPTKHKQFPSTSDSHVSHFSPASQISSLPTNVTATSTITSTYSSSYHAHQPTILPITATPPPIYEPKEAKRKNSIRLPLKLKLTLPNPFRQSPTSPWPPPPVSPIKPITRSSSSWRWSTLSGNPKFKISSWFPGIVRRRSSSRHATTTTRPTSVFVSSDTRSARVEDASATTMTTNIAGPISNSNRRNLQLTRDPYMERPLPASPPPPTPPVKDNVSLVLPSAIGEASSRGKSLRFASVLGRADFAAIA